MSNQDLIYLVFISNPFLNMNRISSLAFTTTSCTRMLQSHSSNSSTKAPCFSNAWMNPLNNSLWTFLLSICSEILLSGGKPYFIKNGKEKLYFSILSLLSWHITFYKIYSTVPFKSFIYATVMSLKKEHDTVCDMLPSR